MIARFGRKPGSMDVELGLVVEAGGDQGLLPVKGNDTAGKVVVTASALATAFIADAHPALAENAIRPGQAACRYSWRMPPRRSRRRMSRRVMAFGSAIGVGSACSGRALAAPWWGRWEL